MKPEPAMADVTEEGALAVADAVRAACLRAAIDGYEQAGFGGMCEEGRWEMVVDSIRSLNLDAIVKRALEPGDRH